MSKIRQATNLCQGAHNNWWQLCGRNLGYFIHVLSNKLPNTTQPWLQPPDVLPNDGSNLSFTPRWLVKQQNCNPQGHPSNNAKGIVTFYNIYVNDTTSSKMTIIQITYALSSWIFLRIMIYSPDNLFLIHFFAHLFFWMISQQKILKSTSTQ